MEETDSFGAMLKQRRKAHDLTQFELADRVGCSSSTIRMVESGERRASRQLAELLADRLDVAPGEREGFLHAARAGASAAQEDGRGDTKGAAQPALDLPAYLTPLVGRDKEIEAIEARLLNKGTHIGVRLLTLTGPAGIGKTRLASALASDVQREFSEGVCFVALATVREPEMVISTIAGALGMREQTEQGSEAMLDSLKKQLLGKEMLLVLDNMEQVLEAGPLIAAVLGACPTVKALVTSREPLHVQGESVFHVPPLLLPDIEKLPPMETLLDYSAVALFVERARAAVSSFALTEGNALEVATICARMDGLPLAIELVAARVKLFSPRALLARLAGAHGQGTFRLLGDGARDLPERHRTLQAAISWSYDLLSKEEQTLFVRLSVFVGGCTLPAIEAVCNAVGDIGLDALYGVSSLLDKSLLTLEREEDGDEEPRFALLQTVREYAMSRLEEPGQAEAEKVRRWHAEYFLALAQSVEPMLTGPEQQAWLLRLEKDHDNLQAALRWLLETGDLEMAAQLSGPLSRFWWVHGHLSEGRRWLEAVLAHADSISPAIRAKVLAGAGVLARNQSDFVRARELLEESVTIRRRLADKPGMAISLKDLGTVVDYQGDLSTAAELYEESLALFRDLGDMWGVGACLGNLGSVFQMQGMYDRAMPYYEESLAIRRAAGDKWGVGAALTNLGIALRHKGDYSGAAKLWSEALELFREVQDKQNVGLTLSHLGRVAQVQGDYAGAWALFWESLSLRREVGDRHGSAMSLAYLADLALSQGDPRQALALLRETLTLIRDIGDKLFIGECFEAFGGALAASGQAERAATLLGTAESLRSAIGQPIHPSDAPTYQRNVSMARDSLDQEAFAHAWKAGRLLSLQQAVDYALDPLV